MTINIFVLKGDLNGKIVVVRFFFCRVYYGNFIDLMVPVARGLIRSVIIWNTIRSWFIRIRSIPSIRCPSVVYPNTVHLVICS